MPLLFLRKYQAIILISLMIGLVSVNAIASTKTGYVVGRAYCKLNGYNNQYKTIITEATVELHYYPHATKKPENIKVQTDANGYFYLTNQPLEGSYRITAIISDGLNIPNPDSQTALLEGSINVINVIDVGENIFILLQNGEIEHECYKANSKRTLVRGNEGVAIKTVKGNYGYPGLEYFSQKGDPTLKESAFIALEDRRLYEKAELYTKEGDEVAKSNKKSAIDRYSKAIEIYPLYSHAYESLFKIFEEFSQEEDLDVIKQSLFLYKSYIVNYQDAKYLMLYNPMTKGYYKCSWFAFKEKQYNLGIRLMNKALFRYIGNSLSEKKGILEKSLSRSRNQQVLYQYWIEYLLTIQSQDDIDNWKGKPFDLHIKKY